jgi:hypothetical protein
MSLNQDFLRAGCQEIEESIERAIILMGEIEKAESFCIRRLKRLAESIFDF